MSTFEELYGITFSGGNDKSLAQLHITEPHLNWYGIAFGGCHMFLSNSSAQHLLGEGYAASHMVFKFLKKAECDDTLTAHTEAIKVGKRTAATETHLYDGDTLVGSMYADFYKIGDTLPFTIDYFPLEAKRPYCDLVINSRDNPHKENDVDAFRRMFRLPTKYGTDLLKNIGEYGSVGIYTDKEFVDINGYVDQALLGALVDSIAGLVWWKHAESSVTVNISMNIFATIKPGAFITCSGQAAIQSGSLYFSQGLFWADDTCIGSYSATFMQVEIPVLEDT